MINLKKTNVCYRPSTWSWYFYVCHDRVIYEVFVCVRARHANCSEKSDSNDVDYVDEDDSDDDTSSITFGKT